MKKREFTHLGEADAYYMKLALQEAHKATLTGDVPVGAVLVCEGRVVAKARNTKEKTNITTRHAEINAIEKAEKKLGRWRLTGCTLYVTMEPCPMCAGAIHQSRIDRVVFGAKDRKHGACGTVLNISGAEGLNHYPEIVSGVLEQECSKILTDFFREIRKNKRQQ